MAQSEDAPRFYDLNDRDDWQTPEWFTKGLQGHGGILLDPCAGEGTSHALHNLRLEDGDDGLEDDWGAICKPWINAYVFVNPPFSYKQEWVDKAIEEYQKESIDAVYILLPDSTDVISYWHEGVVPHAEYVWFKKGRMSFVDPETGEEAGSPSFGTTLSILAESPDDVPDSLLGWLDEHGWLVTEYEP